MSLKNPPFIHASKYFWFFRVGHQITTYSESVFNVFYNVSLIFMCCCPKQNWIIGRHCVKKMRLHKSRAITKVYGTAGKTRRPIFRKLCVHKVQCLSESHVSPSKICVTLHSLKMSSNQFMTTVLWLNHIHEMKYQNRNSITSCRLHWDFSHNPQRPCSKGSNSGFNVPQHSNSSHTLYDMSFFL